jgi:hypothetical protein
MEGVMTFWFLFALAAIVGIVWERIQRIGSFSVIDADMPEEAEVGFYLSRTARLSHMKLPNRMTIRCDRCNTEMVPKIVDFANWYRDQLPTTHIESVDRSGFALFYKVGVQFGHAGAQTTEPYFDVMCANSECGFKGEVRLRAAHKMAKKLARRK